MTKLAACAAAALFGVSCVFAAETVEIRTEEVHVSPETKAKLEAAKEKTRRAAHKAKVKTKSAAKRTRAAAHRAADRVRAAESRPVVRIDTKVESNPDR